VSKGLSHAQLEGLDVRVDGWSELIYPEDEDSRTNPEIISQYFKRQNKAAVVANLILSFGCS